MENERKEKVFGQEMRRLVLAFFNDLRRRLSSFQVLRNLLFRPKEVVSSIDIHGDSAFCEAVKRALLLLKEEDLSTFNLVDRHLNLIIQSGDTLLEPHRDCAALGLDEKGLDSNPTWLACLLAMLTGQSFIRIT